MRNFVGGRHLRPIVDDNPITVQMLGLCSALAVSRTLEPALIMAAAVVSVLIFANVVISALRGVIPRSIRLIVEVTVIASAVTVVDELLKVYAPDAAQTLTIFVGLIITNCIVLGRAESFAMHNGVVASFTDGLSNGIGYAAVLLIIAAVRELLGVGELLGMQVFPEAYPANELMLYAPSAFIILGVLVWGIRTWRPVQAEPRSEAARGMRDRSQIAP